MNPHREDIGAVVTLLILLTLRGIVVDIIPEYIRNFLRSESWE